MFVLTCTSRTFPAILAVLSKVRSLRGSINILDQLTNHRSLNFEESKEIFVCVEVVINVFHADRLLLIIDVLRTISDR